jgi:hypothetical protein
MTNGEFHEVTTVMFGNPLPTYKEYFGTQINRANQNQTVDMYGDNVKTAQGSPGLLYARPRVDDLCGRK